MRSTYPVPGSYGYELFAMDEERYDERFRRAYANFDPTDVPEAAEVGAADMNRLEAFVRLHREILRGERTASPGAPFRPVPSGRTFGMLRWFDPGRATVLGAHFPPLHGEPASLAIGFPLPADADPADRLAEIGFPPPAEEPTFVFGELADDEGQTRIYAPGPEGLAELVYRLRRGDGGWDVLVTAERPPEPRFSELVRAYREAFGERETVRHEDLRTALRQESRPPAETAAGGGVGEASEEREGPRPEEPGLDEVPPPRE